MKTAISLADDTFRRVERAAKRLGMSRSEFFARAAENWLAALEGEGTTEAINRALAPSTDFRQMVDRSYGQLPSSVGAAVSQQAIRRRPVVRDEWAE